MDQAGWHKSRDRKLPDGITVLLPPPYSPELNPVENLWHYLRSHYLSNRSYNDYDALLNAGTDAYRKLTPVVIKSVCRCLYLERGVILIRIIRIPHDSRAPRPPPLRESPQSRGRAFQVESVLQDSQILHGLYALGRIL